MSHNRTILRYGVAVVSTAAALGIRMLLEPFMGEVAAYGTFYLAVLCAVLFGGLGPGLLSVGLGALGAVRFVVPPGHGFSIEGIDHQLGFAQFALLALVIVLLVGSQRKARAAEQRQREWLEVTLASIGDGVIATDTQGRITLMNAVAARLTGWTPEGAQGRPLETVFAIRNEETGEEVENPAVRAIREGRIVGLANHTVLTARDGRRIPLDDSGAPIRDRSGDLMGAVLIFRDVAEARAREGELRERDRMIDFSHDAIIVVGPDRRIVRWNRGARELYGWAESEVRGEVVHEVLKTSNPKLASEVDAVLQRTGRWDGELTQSRRDGRELVVESRQVLLRNREGEVTGILEINRDATDRKRAAAEAEEGRRTLLALMDHIPLGIAVADAAGRVRMASRYGAALAGRQASELESVPVEAQPGAWGLCRADGTALAAWQDWPLARTIARGEIVTNEEWAIRRPDGSCVPILCSAAPIRDANETIYGGLVAWSDISQRKRIEQQLMETAKLESLGVLAGGIAHDFNNLLTGILGNASLLVDEVPPGSQSQSFAEAIVRAAERAATLTRQILAYSGRGQFVIEPIDLTQFIRGTLPLIAASVSKSVELRTDLDDGLPPIAADVGQLQQVIMNLVVNGAEAVGPGSGCVTISTRLEEVAGYGRELPAGRYVLLEVRDDGCGMDEHTVTRIFDPFFTTKFTGRGLGLAAVQGIVRAHKGAIRVESAPGEGATFRVLFPAAANAGPLADGPPPVAATPRAAVTVLVIDDEEIVRATAAPALRKLGHRVLTAETGAEAMEIFQANVDSVSLIILDMTMPGVSGEEALRQLRRIRADIPVILSSGFSEVEADRRFAGQRLAGFLQKPYTAARLAEKVSAALAPRRS